MTICKRKSLKYINTLDKYSINSVKYIYNYEIFTRFGTSWFIKR